jgi:mono/diheme cytochrome c family protein
MITWSRALAVTVALAAAGASVAAASSSVAKPAGKPVMVGNAKLGRRAFVAQECGSCHMLVAAGDTDSSGVGPDLDTTKKTYAQIITQITKGGHGMSPYKAVLTTAQIQDLAVFIYSAAHQK